MFSRPRSLVHGLFLPLALCVATACGGDAKKADGKDADGKATVEGKVEAIVDKAIDEANKELSEDARFDKELQKKACELLTPKMVADMFGVPEGELKQIKIVGCIYSWKNDTETLEARISMLMAHKSEKRAASWFEGATKSLTKEELAAQMDMIKKKVGERKEIDTKMKKKVADDMVGHAADMAGGEDGGVKYEDVPGVGEEARVNLNDGSLWVRVDNFTFSAGGYKGAKQPKVPFDPKNPKAIIEASKKAQKEWLKETLEQRKADGVKVAKAVVANL